MKFIVAILILLCFSFAGNAQNVNNTAPIEWKNYAAQKNGFSVMFPKLPVVIEELNSCSELSTTVYAAYANQTVYRITVVSKETGSNLINCRFIKRFDETTFNEKIEETKINQKFENATKEIQDGRQITSLIQPNIKIKFYNDLSSGKWIEAAVFTNVKQSDEPIEKKFFDSLKLEKEPKGIEISAGANVVLGDATIVNKPENKTTTDDTAAIKKDEVTPMRIVVKPRAPYTDMAREKNTQGAVILRATFMANGSVGAVSVVEGVPHGLTEQAIAAVRKLVFLPQQNNGVNQTVTRTVQYSFSIY